MGPERRPSLYRRLKLAARTGAGCTSNGAEALATSLRLARLRRVHGASAQRAAHAAARAQRGLRPARGGRGASKTNGSAAARAPPAGHCARGGGALTGSG